MHLGDWLLELRGHILAVHMPASLVPVRAALAKLALLANTPERLAALCEALIEVAHGNGGLVKAGQRLRLLDLADQCRQVAWQLTAHREVLS